MTPGITRAVNQVRSTVEAVEPKINYLKMIAAAHPHIADEVNGIASMHEHLKNVIDIHDAAAAAMREGN
jgi:hypothetical protein